MKVIAKTDEYTIYQKRSERYAVKSASRAWVNGAEKVAILLEHKLIEAPAPKAPEPEVAEEAAAADEAASEEASAEGSADAEAEGDSSADEDKADRATLLTRRCQQALGSGHKFSRLLLRPRPGA